MLLRPKMKTSMMVIRNGENGVELWCFKSQCLTYNTVQPFGILFSCNALLLPMHHLMLSCLQWLLDGVVFLNATDLLLCCPILQLLLDDDQTLDRQLDLHPSSCAACDYHNMPQHYAPFSTIIHTHPPLGMI